MEGLTVGELAKQSHVNRETLRYYEKQGLLPQPPRLRSGYRLFPEDSVRQVRFIKHAQELGFSLKEVKELLALKIDPCSTSADVRQRAVAKIADIDEKMKILRAMKKALAALTAQCDGRGPVSECSILQNLSSYEESLL